MQIKYILYYNLYVMANILCLTDYFENTISVKKKKNTIKFSIINRLDWTLWILIVI